MKTQRKIILPITIITGVVILLEFCVAYAFPKLTFVNGNLVIANSILGDLAFCTFIFCILLLFKANKILTIPLGIILFLFFFINSYFEIFPIDTTTQLVDISILQTYKNGNKLIVQECRNVKTNNIEKDTVTVKDNFIFRQIIDNK